MATPETHRAKVARVDYLMDENGREVDVPDNSALEAATPAEQTIGATSPTNWWRLGLVALAIVAALLLILQMLGGNTGTEMIPGTPTAAPQTQSVQP